MMKAAAWIARLPHYKGSHYILSFMLQGLIGISVVVTTCASAKSIIHFKAIMAAESSSIYLSISKMFIRFCSDGLFIMNSLGIITLFTIALATASFTSHIIVDHSML